MKKILGSPIGLGEINLTVDESVRRCIKEYFGNVDNNSFETTITPVEPDGKKQKIVVTADETHLNKVFILKINDVTIYFIPITKVGNKLEAEPYKIRDWDKIKDIAKTTLMFAKLPTTDDEKKAATVWKDDKLGTQDATDDAELGATGKTKENEAVSALEENDCEYEASICCNEDEWKEKIKKEYEKSIESGNIMIFVCCLFILSFTNIHISWVYYGLRIWFLGMIKDPTSDQHDIKTYFEEKKENICKPKYTFCSIWWPRLCAAGCCLVLIVLMIIGINETKKKIKEIDSKNIKDISKDDKENFLKECLMTKDEQAEEAKNIEECESDVTKKWDSSKKKCVDKCENGKICTGNNCSTCECPQGSTYRTYGSLGYKKCVKNCTISQSYCKKKGTCITKGLTCTSY